MNDHAATPSSDTVKNALAVLAVGTVAGVGAVMLSPHILPFIGIGDAGMTDSILNLLHNPAGLAVRINNGLEWIPGIGASLAKGGFVSALTAGAISLGGVLLGHIADDPHAAKQSIPWGKIITYGALATSALIALPTILTALTAGVTFLAGLGGDAAVTSHVLSAMRATFGNINTMTADGLSAITGLTGLAGIAAHLISCGSALLPAALTVQLWRHEATTPSYVATDTQGNPLPPDDPNHQMTQDEIALTERYNGASPIQKIILKKEILERGYEPDFHDNGTIHLYKHPHHDAAATMAR